MTHNQQHIIIHKLKEIAAKYPRVIRYGSLLAAFAGGGWIF